jgi:predicted transcriptional regulator
MQKRVVQYDAFTGEKIEGTLVHASPKRKNGFSMWIALNQGAFEALCSPELTGSDRRVLMALLCSATNDNKLMVSQKEIADRLGMEASNVTRCISRLVKFGFVVKEGRVGHFQILSLHIQYFWRGDARKHKQMMAEMNKPKRATAKSSPSPVVPSHQQTSDTPATAS